MISSFSLGTPVGKIDFQNLCLTKLMESSRGSVLTQCSYIASKLHRAMQPDLRFHDARMDPLGDLERGGNLDAA